MRRFFVPTLLALMAVPVGGCAPAAPPPAPKMMPRLIGAPQPPVDQVKLQSLVEREARKLPGRVAAHVRVDDGTNEGIGAGVDADRSVPAASVAKVPVALAVEHAWNEGRLKRRVEDLERMRAALTVSDNPAADQLIARVGMPAVNTWLRENGYRQTRLERTFRKLSRGADNPTSAAEATRMLLRISLGKAISPKASQELRTMLLAQTRRRRLPAGLPPEATCGNKTGTFGGAVNDVAYVEPPVGPRYAVAVFLQDAGPEPRAELAIARFSQAVYRFLAPARPVATPRSLERD